MKHKKIFFFVARIGFVKCMHAKHPLISLSVFLDTYQFLFVRQQDVQMASVDIITRMKTLPVLLNSDTVRFLTLLKGRS